MTRPQLEHIIHASGGVADDTHIVVVDSQAVLGSSPDAPEEWLVSIEADVYPKHRPENSIVIDGAIGELFMFHRTDGYYAHGIGEETAILPEGWKDRVVTVHNENTNGYTGECLEVHDLAVGKLAAGREKDMDFVQGMLIHRLASSRTIEKRIGQIPARRGAGAGDHAGAFALDPLAARPPPLKCCRINPLTVLRRAGGISEAAGAWIPARCRPLRCRPSF